MFLKDPFNQLKCSGDSEQDIPVTSRTQQSSCSTPTIAARQKQEAAEQRSPMSEKQFSKTSGFFCFPIKEQRLIYPTGKGNIGFAVTAGGRPERKDPWFLEGF